METSGQGLEDSEVAGEVKSFFVRNSMQGGQLQLSYADLVRSFQSLGLVSDKVDETHTPMDNFYKLCS